jgi:hypothetical protein
MSGFANPPPPSPDVLAAAVHAANAKPAELDPLAQFVDQVQTRLEKIEAALNLIVPLMAKQNPGMAPYAAGLASAEHVTDEAMAWAHAHADILARAREYFDVHLRRKV